MAKRAKLEITFLVLTIIIELDKTTAIGNPVESLLINGEDWFINNIEVVPATEIQDNIIQSEKLTLITMESVGQILLNLVNQIPPLLPQITELLKEIKNGNYENIQTRFTRTS